MRQIAFFACLAFLLASALACKDTLEPIGRQNVSRITQLRRPSACFSATPAPWNAPAATCSARLPAWTRSSAARTGIPAFPWGSPPSASSAIASNEDDDVARQ